MIDEKLCRCTRTIGKISIIEENVVYYSAGYVVQNLLNKFTKRSDETANIFIAI